MSLHRCNFCNCDPGAFFIWTSSRNFPRDVLIEKHNIVDKKYIKSIKTDGFKMCYGCFNKLKE